MDKKDFEVAIDMLNYARSVISEDPEDSYQIYICYALAHYYSIHPSLQVRIVFDDLTSWIQSQLRRPGDESHTMGIYLHSITDTWFSRADEVPLRKAWCTKMIERIQQVRQIPVEDNTPIDYVVKYHEEMIAGL